VPGCDASCVVCCHRVVGLTITWQTVQDLIKKLSSATTTTTTSTIRLPSPPSPSEASLEMFATRESYCLSYDMDEEEIWREGILLDIMMGEHINQQCRECFE